MKTITEVEIIEFIKDKSHTQSQVANEYAKLLLWFTGNIVNVNYAIIERWSRSGLVRVKEMAWKIAEEKLNTSPLNRPVITTRTIWAIRRVKDGKYFHFHPKGLAGSWIFNRANAYDFNTKRNAKLHCAAGEIPVHLSITDKTFTTIREIKK